MRRHDHAVLRDIGRRIAEIRRLRGLTQEQLAEVLEMSPKFLQRLEAGSENMGVLSLVQMATALECQLVDLFATPSSREIRRGRPPKKRTRST